MSFKLVFLGFTALLFVSCQQYELEGKIVHKCEGKDKKVYLFKQWHVAPRINTRENPDAFYPQKENQLSIYQDVLGLAKESKIDTLIAEGCEGEITLDFPTTFNGWSIKDLADNKKLVTNALAPIPMKVEAVLNDKIKTVCGDNLQLMEQQNLALSEARGSLGFYGRILQTKDKPEQHTRYLRAAKQVFPTTEQMTSKEVLLIIENHLKHNINIFLENIEKRNNSFVKKILEQSSKSMALVIGGAHADHLIELFEKFNLDCEVIEPKGYENDEILLIEKLKKFVNEKR